MSIVDVQFAAVAAGMVAIIRKVVGHNGKEKFMSVVYHTIIYRVII